MGKRYTGQGGSPLRRRRYSVKLFTRITENADAMLDEMAKDKDVKKAHLVRSAVMKDLYIWKNEREKRSAAAEQETPTDE